MPMLGLLAFALLGSSGPEVRLMVLPPIAYQDLNAGKENLETVVFDVLVKGKTKVAPASARMDLFSGEALVESMKFNSAGLAARKGVRYRADKVGEVTGRALAAEDEQFDIRHRVTEPSGLHLSRISYSFTLKDAKGHFFVRKISIPVQTYTQKTSLIFPIKGLFTVVNGTYSDFGHTERSQEFALDITGLGSHGELFSSDATKNQDFLGWGREILAPGAGRIVYARDDVPSQPTPGVIDSKLFLSLPEPVMAASGNCVVIDHGNGEFSFLAHMQQGSVKAHVGDLVTQGQVIGLLGSSGNAEGPHLHYHLMNGPKLFQSDGLPVHFTNLDGSIPQRGDIIEAK